MTRLTLVKQLQNPNSVIKGISSRIRARDFNHCPKEKWIFSAWYNLRIHMAMKQICICLLKIQCDITYAYSVFFKFVTSDTEE